MKNYIVDESEVKNEMMGLDRVGVYTVLGILVGALVLAVGIGIAIGLMF